MSLLSSVQFDLSSPSERGVVLLRDPAGRPGVDRPNTQIMPFVLQLGGITVIRLMAGLKQRLDESSERDQRSFSSL